MPQTIEEQIIQAQIIATQKNIISGQEKTISEGLVGLQEQIFTQMHVINKQEIEISALKIQTATQQNKIQKISAENAQLKDQMQKIEQENAQIKAQMEKIFALLSSQSVTPSTAPNAQTISVNTRDFIQSPALKEDRFKIAAINEQDTPNSLIEKIKDVQTHYLHLIQETLDDSSINLEIATHLPSEDRERHLHTLYQSLNLLSVHIRQPLFDELLKIESYLQLSENQPITDKTISTREFDILTQYGTHNNSQTQTIIIEAYKVLVMALSKLTFKEATQLLLTLKETLLSPQYAALADFEQWKDLFKVFGLMGTLQKELPIVEALKKLRKECKPSESKTEAVLIQNLISMCTQLHENKIIYLICTQIKEMIKALHIMLTGNMNLLNQSILGSEANHNHQCIQESIEDHRKTLLGWATEPEMIKIILETNADNTNPNDIHYFKTLMKSYFTRLLVRIINTGENIHYVDNKEIAATLAGKGAHALLPGGGIIELLVSAGLSLRKMRRAAQQDALLIHIPHAQLEKLLNRLADDISLYWAPQIKKLFTATKQAGSVGQAATNLQHFIEGTVLGGQKAGYSIPTEFIVYILAIVKDFLENYDINQKKPPSENELYRALWAHLLKAATDKSMVKTISATFSFSDITVKDQVWQFSELLALAKPASAVNVNDGTPKTQPEKKASSGFLRFSFKASSTPEISKNTPGTPSIPPKNNKYGPLAEGGEDFFASLAKTVPTLDNSQTAPTPGRRMM